MSMICDPNVNTAEYWDGRFSSGHWEECGGRLQTACFAAAIVQRIALPRTFSGSILDFGCGLGDAIPVYRHAFPAATLFGTDVSVAAIEKCGERYGHHAKFIATDHIGIPEVDVIIASNVFEHLSNYTQVASDLLQKCKSLYIATPFNEKLGSQAGEHVNSFNRMSFSGFRQAEPVVYACKGWSEYGTALFIGIYFKNLFRPMLGRRIRSRSKQILFHLKWS